MLREIKSFSTPFFPTDWFFRLKSQFLKYLTSFEARPEVRKKPKKQEFSKSSKTYEGLKIIVH